MTKPQRNQLLPSMGEEEEALHAFIHQAEQLSRDIQITSNGQLSLAVVLYHGRTPTERAGMGWHTAHETAIRIHRGEGEERT